MAVRKAKNGKWVSDFYINGKRVVKQHDLKKDAESYIIRRKAKETTASITDMEEAFSSLTVRELTKIYVEEYLQFTKAVKNVSYCKRIVSRWGNYTLSNITPKEVRLWVTELANSGKLSISTIEKLVSYFKRIFNYAIEMEIINQNPISHLSFKKLFKMKNKRNFTINHEQFKEFQELFSNEPWYMKGIISMLWHTGMRIGEIVALLWSEINTDEGVIVLQPEKVKEKKIRTIGLEPEVLSLLKQLKKINARKGAKSKEHVFGITKDLPIRYETIYSRYRNAVTGSKYSHLNMHDLRHCYTKRKRQEGWDKEVIKTQQGHGTDSMFNWYNDIDVDEVTEMSGFNETKKEIIEKDIDNLVKKLKENSIGTGTLHAVIREKL